MSDSDESSDADCYGPALPPQLQIKNKVIGPQLPVTMDNNVSVADDDKTLLSSSFSVSTDGIYFPRFPCIIYLGTQHEESEEEDADGGIGPYPPDDPRSQRIPKAKIEEPKQLLAPKREEWMLVPPKNKSIGEIVGFGGSRKFLARTPDEIKSPENEEVEPNLQESSKAEFEAKCEKERDDRMDEMLKQSTSSKTTESLMELHRKRKKVADEGSKERRPFNRDEDLKVGGLSKEDRDKFIQKTSELGNRFRGGKRKFL